MINLVETENPRIFQDMETGKYYVLYTRPYIADVVSVMNYEEAADWDDAVSMLGEGK